jgi:hypothetical protein
MAVRTTDEAVAGIIEVDDTIALTPFIETASFLVDKVVATAKDGDGNDYYIASDLELIERWLAAHFYAVRDPREQFVGVGRLMQRFQSQVDLNLNNTPYGQQAMLLDVKGGLAQLNAGIAKGGRKKAAVHWLGTPAEEYE